jgi:hypothetical protein
MPLFFWLNLIFLVGIFLELTTAEFCITTTLPAVIECWCTSQVSIANCSSCVVYSYQGVLETVARRVTKKDETKDNKYATAPHFN